MRSYTKSLEWYEQARQWTPGASQTRSKQPATFPLGAYPCFLERGAGSLVWDLDGNEYVDWICSLAAVTIGHNIPHIKRAVKRQIEMGTIFSLPHRLEGEVAERLCQIIPCAEMVRFVKSGSEATEAAIRVARTYTGRDIIVTVGAGYHSWHSWFAAVKPQHPGVPKNYEHLVRSFDYNNLESLRRLLNQEVTDFHMGPTGRHLGEWVAAVILEPTLLTPPAPGFLEGVRDLAHQHGALMIFDEIVTGFRWAKAGGQEYFGVTPDLATFGKGMANGFPIACLVGRRDIMRHAELVSGTFGGDLIGLAACNATLDLYEREPIIETMWKRGTALVEGMQALIKSYGLPARLIGYTVHPKLEWTLDAAPNDNAQSPWFFQGGETERLLMSLWLQETAERGVLFHPAGWNVSASHTEQDVERTLDACDQAFRICALALADGDIRGLLRGEAISIGLTPRS